MSFARLSKINHLSICNFQALIIGEGSLTRETDVSLLLSHWHVSLLDIYTFFASLFSALLFSPFLLIFRGVLLRSRHAPGGSHKHDDEFASDETRLGNDGDVINPHSFSDANKA